MLATEPTIDNQLKMLQRPLDESASQTIKHPEKNIKSLFAHDIVTKIDVKSMFIPSQSFTSQVAPTTKLPDPSNGESPDVLVNELTTASTGQLPTSSASQLPTSSTSQLPTASASQSLKTSMSKSMTTTISKSPAPSACSLTKALAPGPLSTKILASNTAKKSNDMLNSKLIAFNRESMAVSNLTIFNIQAKRTHSKFTNEVSPIHKAPSFKAYKLNKNEALCSICSTARSRISKIVGPKSHKTKTMASGTKSTISAGFYYLPNTVSQFLARGRFRCKYQQSKFQNYLKESSSNYHLRTQNKNNSESTELLLSGRDQMKISPVKEEMNPIKFCLLNGIFTRPNKKCRSNRSKKNCECSSVSSLIEKQKMSIDKGEIISANRLSLADIMCPLSKKCIGDPSTWDGIQLLEKAKNIFKLKDEAETDFSYSQYLTSFLKELASHDLSYSLKGHKPSYNRGAASTDNQDTMFRVLIPPAFVNYIGCQCVCDGHGLSGKELSSNACCFLEGAFTFICVEFMKSLVDSETKPQLDEWVKSLTSLKERMTSGSLRAKSSQVRPCKYPEHLRSRFYTWGRNEAVTCMGTSKLSRVILPGQVLPDISRMESAIQSLIRSLQTHVEEELDAQRSGCTVSILLRLGSQLWLVWLGDSKIVGFQYALDLSTDKCSIKPNHADNPSHSYMQDYFGSYLKPVLNGENEQQPLLIQIRAKLESKDHCPAREASRILQAGGTVVCTSLDLQRPTYRLQPTGIAMSRAIGDTASAKYGLLHVPEMTVLNIPWKRTQNVTSMESIRDWQWVFVLGTDGLWDTLTIEEVAKNLVAGILYDVADYCSMMIERKRSCDSEIKSQSWSESKSEALEYFLHNYSEERMKSICLLSQRRRIALQNFSDDTSAAVFFVL